MAAESNESSNGDKGFQDRGLFCKQWSCLSLFPEGGRWRGGRGRGWRNGSFPGSNIFPRGRRLERPFNPPVSEIIGFIA